MWFYQLVLSVGTAVDDTGEGEAAFGGETYLHTAARANMCIWVWGQRRKKSKSPLSVLSRNDRERSFTDLFYS